MTDPDNAKPEPAAKPPEPRPQEGAQPEPADGGDLYEIAEPGPDSAAGDGDQEASQWHAAQAGGQKQGPLTIADLKQRVAAGQLAAGDLVWKEGMPDWLPAGEIAALASSFPPPMPARPAPSMPSSHLRRKSMPEQAFMQMLNDTFSRPGFFRMIGRIAAGLALAVALGSLISGLVSHWNRTWFLGAVALVLIFVIGEAVAAVLEALGRIQTQLESREPEEPTGGDG